MRIWEPEALKLVRNLNTNCSDFIYGASEYIAHLREHDKVQISDVETVLAFIKANSDGGDIQK